MLKGKDGSCKINGTAVSVTGWTYNGVINKSETTTVGSADQTHENTTRGGSGSITLSFDSSEATQKVIVDMLLTGQTPSKFLAQLLYDTTAVDQLYFSAVLDSVDLPVNANDVDILTVNFTKTGPLYHVPTT